MRAIFSIGLLTGVWLLGSVAGFFRLTGLKCRLSHLHDPRSRSGGCRILAEYDLSLVSGRVVSRCRSISASTLFRTVAIFGQTVFDNQLSCQPRLGFAAVSRTAICCLLPGAKSAKALESG